MSFEALALDELARETLDRFRPAAREKRVELAFRVDNVAPGAGVRILGDSDRLTQVLNNLLSNGIKFTPEGGRLELEVFGPGVSASHVGLSVWNSGITIPEDSRERVFAKFEHVGSSTTRRVGGTGLGLYISRSIVEGHGGKIWVEETKHGTKFVLTLPAAPETPMRSLEAGRAPVVAEAAPDDASGTGNVLIIDGDRHAAYVLKGALMASGHRVHVLHDGDEALAWARERRPDLIVVEAELAGVDGLALVEILKHDPDTRKAAVVIITRGSRDLAAAGADAQFAKPVDLDVFREGCDRLLGEKARASSVKVLVVDDDEGIRSICREVLEHAGYIVREAPDGRVALSEARRWRPDLVLLDVMMPDLDGFQTAKRLRAERDGAMMPIIFVSARGQTADKVRAFKLGAEDYLVKPFDSVELVARVEKALERRDRQLGASPTTRLPGARDIESEVERRLAAGQAFAYVYVDLDNLKAFNDYYGIAKADGVIRQTGDLLREVLSREGGAEDFLGHIAGDDFVFITTPDRVDRVGTTVCATFDRLVPLYYNKVDRERGYIETPDRYGQMRRFAIMSVSVAALTTTNGHRFYNYAELARAAAEAKKRAKAIDGSSFVRDQRIIVPEESD
jgi:DNA-binding response OmpR family regulator